MMLLTLTVERYVSVCHPGQYTRPLYGPPRLTVTLISLATFLIYLPSVFRNEVTTCLLAPGGSPIYHEKENQSFQHFLFYQELRPVTEMGPENVEGRVELEFEWQRIKSERQQIGKQRVELERLRVKMIASRLRTETLSQKHMTEENENHQPNEQLVNGLVININIPKFSEENNPIENERHNDRNYRRPSYDRGYIIGDNRRNTRVESRNSPTNVELPDVRFPPPHMVNYEGQPSSQGDNHLN
ncbi:hypothetical protein KPH14_000933 [Odynerus spinipes]|uniref:G-protein coupled receptors family 1 profile domain-containing protein n=1 Tax=Odynerus spinipes TaxID=1348599 RepID=A0AAD9REP6_9HYME|nr:hypothetical protein KPH14_000933 [Odynerus spinipes]